MKKYLSNNLFKTQLTQFLSIFLILFISTYFLENGDRNAISFRLLLTIPFIFLFCIYNGFAIFFLGKESKEDK